MRKIAKRKACKVCHVMTTKSHCPICKSTNLSESFSGLVLIFDPEKSMIAQKLNINKPGEYALQVR
ncbi:MAG: transcription elongation factor subunit Spt4 [Candidatus Odinarchaeota archaeon]